MTPSNMGYLVLWTPPFLFRDEMAGSSWKITFSSRSVSFKKSNYLEECICCLEMNFKALT